MHSQDSSKPDADPKPPEPDDPRKPVNDGDARNVQDILKKSKRRGLTSKGQQGLVEFDTPPKK